MSALLSAMMHSRRGLFFAAALLALILCLWPARGDAPEASASKTSDDAPEIADANGAANVADAGDETDAASLAGVPAGADLSERTAFGCALHSTLFYAPCGHSVQRREPLPARLVGLSRRALEEEIASVLPGAQVTGFSSAEVDASFRLDIPCPLHWVLAAGERGALTVMRNLEGESLSVVRETDVPLSALTDAQRAALPQVFDDVQALEGVLESLSS